MAITKIPGYCHSGVSEKFSVHSWGDSVSPWGNAHGFFWYRNGERFSGTEDVYKDLGNVGTKDGILYQQYDALQDIINRALS